jgi:hypothetical protein
MLGFSHLIKVGSQTVENSVFPLIALCASFGTFIEKMPYKHFNLREKQKHALISSQKKNKVSREFLSRPH